MKETGKKAGERETWHSQPEVTAQFRWQLAWKLDEWKDKYQVCTLKKFGSNMDKHKCWV